MLNLGDQINVKVIEIDEEKEDFLLVTNNVCLILGLNSLTIIRKAIIKSEIKSITDFGIFVGLEGHRWISPYIGRYQYRKTRRLYKILQRR